VVRDQNVSIADADTDHRYRAYTKKVERTIGQPLHLQYYICGFSAIRQARNGALDMVFGPAQVNEEKLSSATRSTQKAQLCRAFL
jgi:hypothetical protein